MELAPKVAVTMMLAIIPTFIAISQGTVWVSTTKSSMTEVGMYDVENVDVNTGIMGKSYPVINAKNQRIRLNQSYDTKAWVTVSDSYDNNLKSKIEVYGKIDNTKKGDYEIRYVVRNRYGLKTTKKIRVIVD